MRDLIKIIKFYERKLEKEEEQIILATGGSQTHDHLITMREFYHSATTAASTRLLSTQQ